MTNRLDELAEAIHETWRALAREKNWTMQPRFDKPFAKLDPSDQADNRAAARRIPWVLSLAGLGIATAAARPPDAPSDAEVAQQIEAHIHRLAEAEHDGWMDHRLKNGWKKGTPRDDTNLVHPLLVPYNDLPAAEQEKDINTVRHFPEFVRKAGYHIVWLGPEAVRNDRPDTQAERGARSAGPAR